MNTNDPAGAIIRILKFVFWIYVLVLFMNLFGGSVYDIQTYIIGDIVELVLFWLLPCLAALAYFLRHGGRWKSLWNEWKLLIIGIGLIFLAGTAQSVVQIVFGRLIPSDRIGFFPYLDSRERTAFAVIESILFVIKYAGLWIGCLALILRVGMERIRADRGVQALIGAWIVLEIFLMGSEINSLLRFWRPPFAGMD